MSNLVVDSSVAIKWFVAEPHTADARRVLDRYQDGTFSFIAPDLFNAEFGNIVWKKHAFQGLNAADAWDILHAFHTLRFTFAPTKALLRDAFGIAVAHQRTVYDALYLALSLREGCQFVTADEKLVNAVGASFPNVIWLAKWP